LWWALVITLGYAVIEAIAGWWAGSLALLGDAGHMLGDAAALGLAAAAAWFARRPPSPRHSYGLGRIEVVAALANGLFMLLIVACIVSSAVQRLQDPAPVSGGTVTMVAALGLTINVTVIVMLSHGESTLNTRGAMLHVFGDLLGSVAALLSGIVISLTGWTPIDPILSLLICTLIVLSSLRLLRDALHVVMEGVPAHLSLTDVGRAMSKRDGVLSIHDLHIWTLSSGHVALSAHVVVSDLAEWETLLLDLKTVLLERFHIEHTTLQPEPAGQVLARVPLEKVRRERAPETTEAR
jgi:cobalt-zinc-cadmium efflux system protein